MYNLFCITMLILLDFVVIFPQKIIQGNTGRRGSTRSGLLEHGNAEKTDLFSDARQRTVWRSRLFFAHFRTGGFLHEKNYRPGFDADHVSISDY